jgi:hypothetical protein
VVLSCTFILYNYSMFHYIFTAHWLIYKRKMQHCATHHVCPSVCTIICPMRKFKNYQTNFCAMWYYTKHFFIIPTEAHNYKITGMLKTIEILTIAPTCFGSRRNHHQGAISCLAKTTVMILLCSSLMTMSLTCRSTCRNFNCF